MVDAARPRVYVIVPDPAIRDAVGAALDPAVFDVGVTGDARGVKTFAAAGPVSAVLIHESVTQPPPDDLARALHRPLGDSCVFVLVCSSFRELSENSPFAFAFRHPAGPRVLGDRLRRAIAAASPAARADDRELRAEIELRAARLDTQDYYEILGVGARAPADAITAAYDRISLSFHPDRLRSLADPGLREQAMRIYIKVGEAHRVLRNPSDRMRYDRGLGTSASETGRRNTIERGPMAFDELSQNPSAKKHLKIAQMAVAERNMQLALMQLRFAANLDPDNVAIQIAVQKLESQSA
jgi:hypothetical protein